MHARNRLFYLAAVLTSSNRFSEPESRGAEPDLQRKLGTRHNRKTIRSDLAQRASSIVSCATHSQRTDLSIDHFLGKETAQNILVFDCHAIFSPLWNTHYIDMCRSQRGNTRVGTRAGYYETAGALRDMVQNHLIQLLCLSRWNR